MNCCTGSRLVLAAGALVLASPAWTGCSRDPAPEARAEQRPEEQEGPEDQVSPDDDEPDPAHPKGRWKRADVPLTQEQRDEIEKLKAIGYAQGSTPAPARSGVTIHRRERAHPGTNLYTSGHAASAILMDMEGASLHTWRADFARVWPEEQLKGRNLALTSFWRRAHPFENGDLLAIFEGHSLIKLDRDSNVLWKSACGAHHDLAVLPDGDILVLTRKAHVVPVIDAEVPVLEDFITVLGSDGKEKSSLSLLEALDRSTFEGLWDGARARRGDILHTNSLAVLDGTRAGEIAAFRAGNLLVSSRTMSFLAVVDPERGAVAWSLAGSFREQHDPQVLANGNLLLFDNGGAARKASAVLELDPATGREAWAYRGGADAPFYSRFCGTAARLPNGNTLITESDNGRAFEVTPAGEIVWEFWNPERAGEQNEFIATLFEVVRLDPEFSSAWRAPPR